VEFALAALPGGGMNVLDVGCGIGWSSCEMARNYPAAPVLAVDLSPRLVATARSVFGEETWIRFEVKDFIKEGHLVVQAAFRSGAQMTTCTCSFSAARHAGLPRYALDWKTAANARSGFDAGWAFAGLTRPV
jgi:SAM-dependent methyltransferase